MGQQRGWFCKAGAGLVACALVAAMLAAAAATVAATTDTADEKSNVTACVGEALVDWGFTDVPDTHIFFDSINCLAHYGITIGSGDGTTFTPDESVKRWQMMLFLARALDPAGINLSRARAQNFTDLDNVNEEARDAIDLLVTNGIAIPASNRTFDPDGIVDRTEMALLLIRFLDAAGSVVSFDSSGNILLDANGDGSQRQPDDYFKDARDLVPVAADAAISAAYELGITTGADPTPASGTAQPGLDFYYRPRASVTRGQMAAFIIRTLGHTLARPKGLSAQYDGNEIRVSVRGDDFEPVVDAPIDMFFVEAEDANRAFTSRGACADVDFVDGAYACEIDSSDLTTDDEGEVSLTVPEAILDGTDTTLWIWTGREGDEVSRGTDPFRLDVEPSSQPQGAASAKISTAFRGSKARFGTTVTFTVQLVDSRGTNASTGVDGQRPAEWTLTEELLIEASATVDGDSTDSDETLRSKTPRTVRSDSSGRFRFSLSVGDPDRGSVGQSRTRTFKLTPLTNAPTALAGDDGFKIKMSSGRADGDVYYLEFSDTVPTLENSVVTVASANSYINVPSSGSVRNTAVVSVYNEYGEALAAARVSLASDKAESTTLTTQSYTVGRDGAHRFSYSYSGAGGEVEKLTPTVDPDGNSATLNDLADLASAHVFWPILTSTDATEADFYILFADIDRNSIIVDTETDTDGDDWPGGGNTAPERVEYDSNDRFDVQRTGDTAPRPVAGIDEFEKALAEAAAAAPMGDTGTDACLQWSNYDPGRSRFVAQFTLKLDGCS